MKISNISLEVCVSGMKKVGYNFNNSHLDQSLCFRINNKYGFISVCLLGCEGEGEFCKKNLVQTMSFAEFLKVTCEFKNSHAIRLTTLFEPDQTDGAVPELFTRILHLHGV